MPFSMRFLVCQSLLSVDNVNVSHLHISISFLSFSLCLCCVSFRCASEFGKKKKQKYVSKISIKIANRIRQSAVV